MPKVASRKPPGPARKRSAAGLSTSSKAPAAKPRPAPAAKTSPRPVRKRIADVAADDARPARRRNREQTINDILDAAERLLDQKGPDGFGLAELGRAAGVSFGLIHHYFGGKEGLLREVLRRTLRQMGREIRRIQETGAFWDTKAPAVVVVFDTYLRKPGFARLMAWGLLKDLLVAEEVSLEVQRDREALDMMVDRLREGMPGASRIDAAALTTLLTSAVLGFNLLRPLLVQTRGWNARSDEILREQLVRAMISIARPKSNRA
ncbi:MAG TPA: helix-turn-helix domain-containing protein [Candidatus Limnocylindrales bacterium]|nr:helix-turn-helix domain-containing protein [Candidatus Limnocylindrales bacterium]